MCQIFAVRGLLCTTTSLQVKIVHRSLWYAKVTVGHLLVVLVVRGPVVQQPPKLAGAIDG